MAGRLKSRATVKLQQMAEAQDRCLVRNRVAAKLETGEGAHAIMFWCGCRFSS